MPRSALETALDACAPIPPEELTRRKRGAEKLKERLGRVPYYAKKAESDPDYWDKFYASRIFS